MEQRRQRWIRRPAWRSGSTATRRARQGSGAWEEIDDFTGLFAPGGDFMAYTRAATDVVQHPPALRSTPLGEIRSRATPLPSTAAAMPRRC
ncbi:MAG: hypothetical protein R2854_29995 [Caldilineaceae bacterium]